MRWVFLIFLFPCSALAESLVALRTIPARSVLAAADITQVDAAIPGAVTDANAVLGQEARVTVFAGRPIKAADFVAPALVERNQIVSLVFAQGALQITAEGRALDRAGEGEFVRVMNLASRSTVNGVVIGPGIVRVGAADGKD